MLEESVIESIVGDQFDRIIRYRHRWDIYGGDVLQPLKVGDNGEDDNVVLPVLRTFVQKSRSFLFGKGFTYELGDQTGGEADLWLAEILRRNRYQSLALKQATNGGVTGDNFVKFVPDAGNAQSVHHRFVVLDPSNVTPVWEPDDHEDIWAWIVRVNTVRRDGKPVMREQQWIRNDNSESWEWSEYEAELGKDNFDKNGTYIPRRDQRFKWSEITKPQRWEYAWAPFFHNQNLPAPNTYWGESDIECSVEHLANALIRLASNTNKTIRHFAHPQTVALGINVDDWDRSIGKPLVSENDDAKVFNLEMQSDMGATLEFFNTLLDLLHEAARIPRVATGKVDNVGQLSGLALKILYGPLLELTGDKQVAYGDMHTSMFERVIEFGGHDLQKSFVVVKFPDPLPQDAKTQAETAKAQQDAGASQRTTLEEMGFEPDTEFENRDEERAQQPDTFGLMQRVAETTPPAAQQGAPDDAAGQQA